MAAKSLFLLGVILAIFLLIWQDTVQARELTEVNDQNGNMEAAIGPDGLKEKKTIVNIRVLPQGRFGGYGYGGGFLPYVGGMGGPGNGFGFGGGGIGNDYGFGGGGIGGPANGFGVGGGGIGGPGNGFGIGPFGFLPGGFNGFRGLGPFNGPGIGAPGV